MKIALFILLQAAIIVGVFISVRLIIKILKDKESEMKTSYRLIMPSIGISILIFYFIKHIIEL